MELIDGNKIAATLIAELKNEVSAITGRKPCLALVRVGDDPASVSYVTKKEKTSTEIGITSHVILPPVTISQEDLFALIDRLNLDPHVDGILVQSPLPKHIDEVGVFRRIAPGKDVDGLGTMNLGKVAQDDETGFVSCTPAGIMELLARSHVDLKGKHVVVLGRSLLVGKPVALLALQKKTGANGTVTTVTLPGALRAYFTGGGIRHADGRQLQRVGLQPHIRVRPTAEGLAEGRDEVLEEAISFLANGK